MSPTWDEYLADLARYLAAAREAAELGSGAVLTPPVRPAGFMPEHRRDEAERLARTCDELAAEVATRLASVRGRSLAWRTRPHEAVRPANFIQTEM